MFTHINRRLREKRSGASGLESTCSTEPPAFLSGACGNFAYTTRAISSNMKSKSTTIH